MNNIREEFEEWFSDNLIELYSFTDRQAPRAIELLLMKDDTQCYIRPMVDGMFIGYKAASEAKDKEIAELRARMLAAEAYIAECPCDPDIYESQYKAYAKWQELKNER